MPIQTTIQHLAAETDVSSTAGNHRAIEWLGAVTGILGALLMALAPHMGIEAYCLWLVSSSALTLYGIRVGALGIALMSTVYTVINLLGLFTRL